jgi:hypothetical protein
MIKDLYCLLQRRWLAVEALQLNKIMGAENES